MMIKLFFIFSLFYFVHLKSNNVGLRNSQWMKFFKDNYKTKSFFNTATIFDVTFPGSNKAGCNSLSSITTVFFQFITLFFIVLITTQ